MTAGPDKDIAMTVLTGGETAELPELGAAIGRGLAHAAATRPVAILVDRFEWADQASVDLAVLLMRRVGTARVMVVLASRPGAGPVEAIALVGPSWVSRLRLAPLSNERIAEMLQALLPGGVSPELAVKLATRADGNPAFAEEIALVPRRRGRHRADRRRVDARRRSRQRRDPEHDPGADRGPHRRAARRVPPRAAGSIRHRQHLHRRSPDAATATNPETVPGALAELVVAELLRAPSDLEDDDDLEYGFKSPVVREVAVREHPPSPPTRVSPAGRQRALIAQQSDNEGLVELLAHHFLYADDPENGVKYLDLAAARAQAAGAHRTAEQMLTRALTLAARHPGTIADDILGDLHERRGVLTDGARRS